MQPLLGPAEGDRLHVMSYNLRYPADEPGHQWEERRPAMAALLNLELPTLIGTQEGFAEQLRDVLADLPTGYVLGCLPCGVLRLPRGVFAGSICIA